MILEVSAASHMICALVYAAATALIAVSRTQHRYKALLLTVCAITSAWSLMIFMAGMTGSSQPFISFLAAALEQFRSAGWIAVAAVVLIVSYDHAISRKLKAVFITVTAAAGLYGLFMSVATLSGMNAPEMMIRAGFLAQVMMAVIALLLIENLFRNSNRESRWSVKYLCFGLGIIFSYDFYIYAEAALLGHINPHILAMRGMVDTLALPLILLSAVRSKSMQVGLHVSRSFVFHSATLICVGIYLILMAGMGYWLRAFDSAWGMASQIGFLVAAMLVLAIVISSGEIQARLKSFISRNFFTYKYDYRAEWLRFISAISNSASELTIPHRVIHALANIIGSTSGGIWIKQDDEEGFRLAGTWNMADVPDSIPANDPWISAYTQSPVVIDLTAIDKLNQVGGPPAWLQSHPRAVILLPLIHEHRLIGFVVLGELRAPIILNWEDIDLLRTAASHAASYVAEDCAAQALAQVRRFEDFNQRFAFIVHDVKNLAAQMTLILKNAERHGENPEFRKDMLHTVAESVARLRTMLEKLTGSGAAVTEPVSIDLVKLLRQLAVIWRLQLPKLEASLPSDPVLIFGDADQLRAVINHLIQNAADAAGQHGTVCIELHIEGLQKSRGEAESVNQAWWAVITVADDGPGMEASFVKDTLFQPLRSSKSKGFGIGAFQAKQTAREMGGQLEVESKCGQGTRMMVRLPYLPPTGAVEKTAYGRPPGILKFA